MQRMQPVSALCIAIPAFCAKPVPIPRIVARLTMQMPDDELDRREITTAGQDHARFENGKAGYVKAPINRFQTALWVNAPRGRRHGIHCLPEDHASELLAILGSMIAKIQDL